MVDVDLLDVGIPLCRVYEEGLRLHLVAQSLLEIKTFSVVLGNMDFERRSLVFLAEREAGPVRGFFVNVSLPHVFIESCGVFDVEVVQSLQLMGAENVHIYFDPGKHFRDGGVWYFGGGTQHTLICGTKGRGCWTR